MKGGVQMKDEIASAEMNWNGTTYRTILTAEASGGQMSVVDSVSPPQSGPPRHIHHAEDETFVLLSGECEFWLSGETRTAGAGETVFVPRGTEHTFKVISDHPCRHLVILTPSGFENFFREMADGQFRIPEEMSSIEDCAKRHSLSFTGPPL